MTAQSLPPSRRSSAPTRTEARGSAAPVAVVAIGLAFACCAAVSRGFNAVASRARAQNIADAAVLALASHGVDGARRVVHISHSTLVDTHDDGTFVEVTVRVGSVTASASAMHMVSAGNG